MSLLNMEKSEVDHNDNETHNILQLRDDPSHKDMCTYLPVLFNGKEQALS